MREWVKENIALKAWGIFGFTTVMSIWAWSRLGTDITNAYRLFPLLGLIAFGTMWGHYMVWATREWSGADAEKTALYSSVTQWIVLVAIIAHPVLLISRLNMDGLGLPPESYSAYVGDAMVKYVFLGMLALTAFLAFEFKKWLQPKARVWKGVLIANHLAMLAIIVHGFQLGNSIKQMPLKVLWPIYAVTLLGAYLYLAYKKKLV